MQQRRNEQVDVDLRPVVPEYPAKTYAANLMCKYAWQRNNPIVLLPRASQLEIEAVLGVSFYQFTQKEYDRKIDTVDTKFINIEHNPGAFIKVLVATILWRRPRCFNYIIVALTCL